MTILGRKNSKSKDRHELNCLQRITQVPWFYWSIKSEV